MISSLLQNKQTPYTIPFSSKIKSVDRLGSGRNSIN